MSTRSGVSAFGVIHKAEYEPGQYKPISQMDASERGGVRYLARTRRVAGELSKPWSWNRGEPTSRRTAMERAPKASRHDLGSVFQAHGYARRVHDDPMDSNSGAKLKREFDPSHHTPSPVHAKIHYGESVPPKMRQTLDTVIDPKLAGRLKHPVVFHHDRELTSGAHAAAVSAHQTTGGRGHVVLGRNFTGDYKPPRGQSPTMRRDAVNHEIGHAMIRGKPEHNTSPTRNLGEEARADTVSGTKLYVKNGLVPKRKVTGAVGWVADRAASRSAGGEAVQAGLEPARRYHAVTRMIEAAKKVKKL